MYCFDVMQTTTTSFEPIVKLCANHYHSLCIVTCYYFRSNANHYHSICVVTYYYFRSNANQYHSLCIVPYYYFIVMQTFTTPYVLFHCNANPYHSLFFRLWILDKCVPIVKLCAIFQFLIHPNKAFWFHLISGITIPISKSNFELFNKCFLILVICSVFKFTINFIDVVN